MSVEEFAPLRADEVAEFAALDPNGLSLAPRADRATLRFLLTRRSTPAKTLRAPGPDRASLELMLRAASRVPDHKKLAPWRFIIIAETARARLAEACARRMRAAGEPEDAAEKARRGMSDGPTMVVVVARVTDDVAGVPEVEQISSAAVAAGALVNAALAMGWGANWLTGWAAHDAAFGREELGLGARERVIGFVHLGAYGAAPPERPRPPLDEIVSDLD